MIPREGVESQNAANKGPQPVAEPTPAAGEAATKAATRFRYKMPYRYTRMGFQLPLSGSRSRKVTTVPVLDLTAFNSLSRDHLMSYLASARGGGIQVTFQLPLSGSPSPIPGFFGSPRLSAAAPLRTNDF